MITMEIKAELYDLQHHNCTGRFVMTKDGIRDPDNPDCSNCNRAAQLRHMLEQKEKTGDQLSLTKIEEELLAVALKEPRSEPEFVLSEFHVPDWEDCDSMYGNWEFCVPEGVSERWGELSMEAKLVAYLVGSRGVELIPDRPED